MDEPLLLKEILKDAMEAHGYSITKLAETSGVAEAFIKNILIDGGNDAPPLPYARGYILKIAKELELGGKELWNSYLQEFAPHGSGLTDTMPKNRFAIERMNVSAITMVGIGIFIIAYLVMISDRLIGAPHLTITNPQSQMTIVNIPIINISGSIQNKNDTVTINEIALPVKERGEFEKNFTLENGTNNFTIKAKRLLGREIIQTFNVIYEPTPPPPESPPETNEQLKKNKKPA